MAVDEYGCGILGKLRFPAAAGICGRLSVLGAAQSGANVLITTVDNNLITGDLVDFTGVAGLGASLAVTVVDAVSFTVPGTLGAWSAGGYVKAHGAPEYWVDDDDSKGDFVVLLWRQDFREVGERARLITEYTDSADCVNRPGNPGASIRANQSSCGMPAEVYNLNVTEDCLAFSVCDPQVVCGSPNYTEEGIVDVFRNGTTYAFDETDFWKMGDSRYGFVWQGAILFDMPDPLWQYPHKPCRDNGDDCTETGCNWTMDDGSCPENLCVEETEGDYYFPHWAYREARSSLPTDGAGHSVPALPTGLHINILTVAELATASPSAPNGVVVPPPVGPYGDESAAEGGGGAWPPPETVTPWGTYIAMMYCTCRPGQFADDYEAQGVSVNCP